MTKQFIRVLPFYTQAVVGEPELEPPMPVALWRCDDNVCEGSGPDSPCDDGEGLYYTVAGDEATLWCPRHWYEAHFVKSSGQRLLAMTDEQYRKECHEHRQRLAKTWEAASERVQSAARLLGSVGLTEAAGKLWQAHGAVRAHLHRL